MLSQKICTLVLAGKRQSDPLSLHFGLENKAFINLKGKFLLEWVLEALEKAKIPNIIISLQKAQKKLFETNLKKNYQFLEVCTNSSPINAVFEALKLPISQNGLLITTADNVLLSAKIIEYFLNICEQSSSEIIIAVVNGQENLVKKYPQAKRTWHKLNAKTWLSGANLFFWKPKPNSENSYKILWRLEASRKSPLQFAQIIAQNFNFIFFLKLLFRQTSISECNIALSKALGLKVELVVLPFEEACIDVDRLEDLELVNTIL